MKASIYSLLLLTITISANHLYAQQIAIANEKMNVMYVGISNPITAVIENTPCNDVSVTLDSASIKRTGPCQFECIPTLHGDFNLKIFVKKKFAGERKYRIKYIPDPIITLGGLSKGGIKADILKAQLGLVVSIPDFDFNANFLIERYELSILPVDAKDVSFTKKNIGAKFDNEVLTALRKIKPGDKIFIEEIYVHGPDNRSRPFSSIILTVY